MNRKKQIAATLAVAVYVLAMLAGLLCLAAILPGLWALLVLPLGLANGWIASDMLGKIWGLEGQYDDGI